MMDEFTHQCLVIRCDQRQRSIKIIVALIVALYDPFICVGGQRQRLWALIFRET